MIDRHAPRLSELRKAVLASPGVTTPALRRAVAERGDVPAAIADYVATLHEHADRVAMADLESLQRAGYHDDAIFEITVAAAVGAASHRCARALAVLDEEW